MDNLQDIQANLHSLVWYRLSKSFNKLLNTYTVNPTVHQLFNTQAGWSKTTREELQSLAIDMFDNNGFQQFQRVARDLRNPAICKNRLNIILYICIQICKLYVEMGETFAVKYFIIEMQQNLAHAIRNRQNKSETIVIN